MVKPFCFESEAIREDEGKRAENSASKKSPSIMYRRRSERRTRFNPVEQPLSVRRKAEINSFEIPVI